MADILRGWDSLKQKSTWSVMGFKPIHTNRDNLPTIFHSEFCYQSILREELNQHLTLKYFINLCSISKFFSKVLEIQTTLNKATPGMNGFSSKLPEWKVPLSPSPHSIQVSPVCLRGPLLSTWAHYVSLCKMGIVLCRCTWWQQHYHYYQQQQQHLWLVAAAAYTLPAGHHTTRAAVKPQTLTTASCYYVEKKHGRNQLIEDFNTPGVLHR